jgi:thiamine biosynthesis lipoprotein
VENPLNSSITAHGPAAGKDGPGRRYVCWGAVGLVLLVLLAGCRGRREIRLAGKTMGTTYHITIVGGYFTAVAPLQKAIDERLAAINTSMSTYQPDSTISRFNRLRSVDRAFPIDADFQTVMKVSQTLYRITDGAWDGTLDPLIDLWGFGRTRRPEDRVPSAEEIKALLPLVGFGHIVMDTEGRLHKRLPSVSLDLASVAKGYGVDAVAALIRDRGFTDYIVEIGGEVYAAGTRMDGEAWRVGINKPDPDAPYDQVYRVVHLQDRAFATSGDYRNFFEIDGRRYAHIIDPRTGYPVSNGVVSVSVTADNCVLADGLATALMVMGASPGLDLVDRLEGVECLIITRDTEGRLHDHASRGFRTID